ncbi:HGGxSTG domain-containing protein [Mycobacterium intracellulare]|uniref:HGGxSTG domain-containing protein n=1 Tax=Mycobacterium intracellulare TaxID=1767 RepID=UPI000CE51A0F|nr:HGGxSTG domain-containing protein [Mycobacterium intracellulare]
MSNDEPEIIDAEIVEDDCLPAVIEQGGTHTRETPIEADRLVNADRDWPHGPTPGRRCVAHKKNGEQCKNAAIKGATVCRYHGGAAPHVKRAARARLENAADLMAKQLLGIALTAEGEAVKLAAIRDALDRAGLKPPAEVVLSQGETKPYEDLFDDIAGGSRAESRRARGLPDTEDIPAGFGAKEYNTPPPPAVAAETHPQPAPPREPRPRETTRERDAQPPARHITGEAAMRAANEANRQIGALKAIEGPHKRYPRP